MFFRITVPRSVLADWSAANPGGREWHFWFCMQLWRVVHAVRRWLRDGGQLVLGRLEGLIPFDDELAPERFLSAGWTPDWIEIRRRLLTDDLVVERDVVELCRRRLRTNDRRQAILYIVWLAIEIDRFMWRRFKKWAELGVVGVDGVFRSAERWAYRRLPGREAPPNFPVTLPLRDQLREWLALVAGCRPRPVLRMKSITDPWPRPTQGAWYVRPKKPGKGPIFAGDVTNGLLKAQLAVVSGEPPRAASRSRRRSAPSEDDSAMESAVSLVPTEFRVTPLEWPRKVCWLGGPAFYMLNLLQDPASIEPIRECLTERDAPTIVCAEVVPREWLDLRP